MPCLTKVICINLPATLTRDSDVITYLREEIYADQHLYEVVGNQSVFEVKCFAIFHETWSPRVHKVKVEPDNRQPRHG